ncbi:MAG: DUF6377 domain-containing protein [Bacteroides sp.]|nr:DUF6377 domain-containing protein [Bacteroides sp.]
MKIVLNIITLLIFSLCAVCSNAQISKETEDVLSDLDNVIDRKSEFHKEKENYINGLKSKLSRATSLEDKDKIYKDIYNVYIHYQADSAMRYIELRSEYAMNSGNVNLHHEMKIDKALALSVMGMYIESMKLLKEIGAEKLNDENRCYYYIAMRTCYGWITEYITNKYNSKDYEQTTSLYRDSIILTMQNGVNKDIVLAESEVIKGKAKDALEILDRINIENLDDRQKAYLHYTLSQAYEVEGKIDEEVRFLALASMADIKFGVREYAALQKLAYKMFELKDYNRAYKYLANSMEDAVSCNARLRFIEVAQIFPIIDNIYKENERQEKIMYKTLLISVSIMFIFLLAAVYFLYRGMKRLHIMKQDLSLANKRLKEVNLQLEQTGKIKEMYITQYLDRCVKYIEKLDAYRRNLVKLSMASRIDDLFKTIKSDELIKEEREDFYKEFDKTFLKLFPDFVNSLNNMLIPEARVELKQGELLNTELRIFALIRLGVTDSNHIAKFLDYSLTTIYNYRSRMRNKALGDKETFEERVMHL